MKIVEFLPDKLGQWDLYKKDEFFIWITGDNTITKYDYLVGKFSKFEDINKDDVKNIMSGIVDHFGIVVIAPNWSFAAVDCARTCPIFWKKIENSYIMSPQAKIIADTYKSQIDSKQLLAFQMSGYTINEGTLWKDINNLNPGHFIFIKNQEKLYLEKYFFYKPWVIKNQSYEILKNKLKIKIKEIIKKLIKNANGRNIAVPLSAGLDSRLVASGLKELQYNNVKCYSYGLKNNYESNASKIISKQLGYNWTFVEITQRKAKNFYKSEIYKNFISKTPDGCATTSIQGLYAIDYLINEGYLSKDDIIVNGNSGDFITGGHIPALKPYSESYNNINLVYDNIIETHFTKHYALWNSLVTRENKNIIKKELLLQIKKNSYEAKIDFMPEGIAEFLEYENRQAKFVNNCQRIYEVFNLKWQLPLWDKSFIEFWSNIPLKYKINQKLYKDTLIEMNMGGVWSKKYEFKYYLTPNWLRMLRFIFKVFFLFIGRSRWHKFEKRYLNYWSDNICGESIFPYIEIIKNMNGARHYISWYTIIAENMNLNSNWQNIKIDQDK